MEKLNKALLNLYEVTHQNVITFYTESFPIVFALSVQKLGVTKFKYTEKELQEVFVDDNLSITDIYIIMKALDYNVTIDNINLTITVSI